MNSEELLALHDRQLRFASIDPITERQAIPPDDPLVVRCVPLDRHARWGWVIWSRLGADDADRVIAEQVAYFTARGQNFEWKRFGHDTPADLDERLLRHGFSAEEHESVMVRDLDSEAGFPAETRLHGGGVEVHKITDPADLDKVVAIEDAVWNESHAWIMDELRQEFLLPGQPLSMYLAYVDGVPASAAWIRFHEQTDFASLFGGSTLPEFRGRGLYTALLDVRAQEARARGYRFLSVDASEMSRPILEKHGFVQDHDGDGLQVSACRVRRNNPQGRGGFSGKGSTPMPNVRATGRRWQVKRERFHSHEAVGGHLPLPQARFHRVWGPGRAHRDHA